MSEEFDLISPLLMVAMPVFLIWLSVSWGIILVGALGIVFAMVMRGIFDILLLAFAVCGALAGLAGAGLGGKAGGGVYGAPGGSGWGGCHSSCTGLGSSKAAGSGKGSGSGAISTAWRPSSRNWTSW